MGRRSGVAEDEGGKRGSGRKALFWVSVTALVVLAAGATLWRGRITPEMYPGMLRETSQIVLVRYNPHPTQRFVLLEDEEAIKEFVAKMKLVAKEPCLCGFVEHLEFHTERGVLRVLMSDHCLIVRHGEKEGNSIECEMPEGLWELYQSHRARVVGQPDM